MTGNTIVLGSRGSRLSLWQTEHVLQLLQQAAPQYDYQVQVVRTRGDKVRNVALHQMGGTGIFTKELEVQLLDGHIDLCVHSTKDMPTQLPDGLVLSGMPRRADPRDVLVSPVAGLTIQTLPKGARVATGSLRRVAQMKRLRSDVEVCGIRGNVDTRVRRVMDGEFDAAVLAAAGMERLGMQDRIASYIPVDQMLPAAGQGAIAVETRADDERINALVASITDEPTMRCVGAERRVLAAMGGSCQVPFGVYARDVADGAATAMRIDAFVSSLDGQHFLRASAQGSAVDSASAADPAALADQVVADLKERGADQILEELQCEQGTEGRS
ncbi:MAG: hydroxymethylbilane synthase [Atopobiaceae bacterium]